MAHSYHSLLIHVTFATKDRGALILPATEPRLYSYLGGIVRAHAGELVIANGVDDHVHLLARISAATPVAELVGKLKGSSSRWMHESFPEQKAFAWQRGYGAFSVSESQRDRVAAYIARQKEHHRVRSFDDEFRALLKAHGIALDQPFLRAS